MNTLSVLYNGKVVKELVKASLKKSGRNNKGRITTFHKGSAIAKKKVRLVDFRQDSLSCAFIIRRLEYDPNRTGFIALCADIRGYLSYILAYEGCGIGQIRRLNVAKTLVGSRLELSLLNIGTIVHNIQRTALRNSQYVRAAGASAQIIKQLASFTYIKLKSGKILKCEKGSLGTIGTVSNSNKFLINKRKAGYARRKGLRPIVRGVAMNPIDHPHGGGEGKSAGGRASVSPWGILTKGYKTKRSKQRVKHKLIS